uniref:No apical meristem-associated C-terminal domain-containing protein n=1 Tax=Globodera rostochiensis TaxID=31243 RepID=A0A914IBN7_GLORO
MHHPPRTKTNGWAEGRGGKVVQQMADNKNATGAGSKSLTPVAMAAGSKGKGRRKVSFAFDEFILELQLVGIIEKEQKMCEWEEQMRLKEAEYERMKREIAERDRMITEQARMIAEQARMIEERDGWIRTATGQPELDHMEDEDEEEEQNENVDEAGANEAGYVASRYEPFGAGWARGFSNDVKN